MIKTDEQSINSNLKSRVQWYIYIGTVTYNDAHIFSEPYLMLDILFYIAVIYQVIVNVESRECHHHLDHGDWREW